jgi:hypothetical protein
LVVSTTQTAAECVDIGIDASVSTHPTTMTLGEDIPEDVAAEIEAIRAMYGGDDDAGVQKVLRIQKLMTMRKDDDDDAAIPTVEIRLDATPSASTSPDGTTYASATLVMTCAIDGSYPLKSAPTARLEDARGVEEDDERRVRQALDDAIEAHAGEHVMTLLCEIAREAMEGVNSPRGACAFCREDMGETSSTSSGRRCRKLSECWHAFHADCFVEWYEWREGVIRVELEGDGAHPPGSEEAKRARERAAHCCPVCRARVSDADADGFRRAAAGAGSSSTGGRTRTRRDASDEDARDALRALDADARAALEEMRRRFEKSALAQDASGGRIDERTAGQGVVIDESTTFHRRDASASSSGAEISTAGKAAVAPASASSSRTTKASGSRGKKDWLARAARKPKPGTGDTT